MKQAIQSIREALKGHYPPRETEGLIRTLLHTLHGMSLTDMVLQQDKRFSDGERETLREITDRLIRQEPIQYILGQTQFCGIRLKVTPAVLIPRPETEELAGWIIRDARNPEGSILDIGTGSGCIALALKAGLPGARVAGCDLSEEIVALAAENAAVNHLEARFFRADILRWEEYPDWERQDIIVSNPPYVTPGEKRAMKKNVLAYEPFPALFFPGQDPLLFYRRITGMAVRWLNPGGELYVEINERFGDEVGTLLLDSGFGEVEIKKDLHGKARMVRGVRIPES